MVNSRLNRFGSSVVGSGAVRGQCAVFYLYLHSILKGLRRIVMEDKDVLSKDEILDPAVPNNETHPNPAGQNI